MTCRSYRSFRGQQVGLLLIMCLLIAFVLLPLSGESGAADFSGSEALAASTEVITILAAKDTYINRDEPDESYAGSPTLAVGYKRSQRALLSFDLGSIPSDVAIDKATLQLYAAGWSGDGDTTIGAYVVLRDWMSSEATWNEAATGVPWGEPGCDGVGTDRSPLPEGTFVTSGPRRWYELDLTDAVQGWVIGAVSNHGVLLINTQELDRPMFYFGSKEGDGEYQPRLVVEYHYLGPSPTPTNSPTVTLTPTESATPTSTATNTPTPTSTPVPPLSLVKIALPHEPVPATWNIHYTLIVSNTSTSLCANVVLTDTKDSRTYYHYSQPRFDDRLGQDTFVWYLGDLAPGEQRTVFFIVSTGPSLANQIVRNQASVDSDQSDPLTVVHDTRMGPVPPTATPTPTHTRTPTVTPTRTNTPQILRVVDFHLDPRDSVVTEGDIFEVNIRVDAGSQPVDGAEVHLDFDSLYLQVVDADGDPASDIESSGVLDVPIRNHVDNAAGQIDFMAGTFGVPPSGTFVLATVRFRALQRTAAGGTALTFVTELPRKSDAMFVGASVLDQVHHGIVRIGEPTPTPTSRPTSTSTPTATVTPIIYRVYLPIIAR